ncbi:hypothetical protein [Leptolyngbya sp. PCC 6406]|uniref:hypothetical protein n=1 Tax=Leptolyngbya sp. PCC 6406 TaxID=1173264 RepID=UPI0002AC4531|nr:hypothetical protein [Leptolyngbya sp. PCC 6406]
MHWAILSGIEGNLAAYEAVLADIKRQRYPVTDLYILGDVVGLRGDNGALVQRVRWSKTGLRPSHLPGELSPKICLGWWEEQVLSLAGLGAVMDAPELQAQYGLEAVQVLWQSISRETVQWVRSLDFGFHELDCLLIHGSTAGCGDELTPETPAIQLCDRLIRADANTLFCGRSGSAFDCWVEPQGLRSTVTTLNGDEPPQDQGKTARRVVGVGTVGRQGGQATYTLYQPANNQVTFKTVRYGSRGQGFA